MHLKQAGFFCELNHGDGLPNEPSIHERLDDSVLAEKPNILAYLEAGSIYAIGAGLAFDYFRQSKRHVIDNLMLLTDGTWLWPSDFAYYVRHYHVAVPEAFVTHMKVLGWRPPSLNQEELIALSRQSRF